MNGGDIRSVLVASDFSTEANHAAGRAALLAQEHGAGLRLMTVVRENLLAELRRHLGAQSDTTRRIMDGARLDLDALAARLEAIASVAERIVRAGDVVTEILAAADHSDILVLGAHGLSPTRDLLIGTTAERLLRKGRRPMIVVRRESAAPYRRVFVSVDFSIHSIAALEFAGRIAPQAELLVFHAFENPPEGKMIRADIPEDSLLELQSQHRDQAIANVRNLIEKSATRGKGASSVVAPGNPRHLVHSTASEWQADLIVVGKQGRSAIGELFLGSVTRHTLARAHCDVAVVPDYLRP